MGGSVAAGLGAAGAAVVLFGSQGVPIKRAKTGDGFFFQFILCCGIWLVGFIVQLVYQSRFELFAMLGGFFWCTGNILTIPIVKTIGFSYGMLIYSTTNFLMGWGSGKFGLFGLKPDAIANPTLNTIGALVSLLRIVILAFMDSKVAMRNNDEGESEKKVEEVDSEASPLLQHASVHSGEEKEVEVVKNAFVDRKEAKVGVEKLHYGVQKLLGIVMALIAGFLYGVNFDPAEYLKDNPSAFLPPNSSFNHSSSSVDYVFSHYTGILVSSSLYFFFYCGVKVAKKSTVVLYGDSVLFAGIAGVMWGLAQFGWFVANQNLEFIESFPLVTSGPSLVASLWGIFLFKEIRGKKNYILTAAAFCVVAISDTLVVMSKQ